MDILRLDTATRPTYLFISHHSDLRGSHGLRMDVAKPQLLLDCPPVPLLTAKLWDPNSAVAQRSRSSSP